MASKKTNNTNKEPDTAETKETGAKIQPPLSQQELEYLRRNVLV